MLWVEVLSLGTTERHCWVDLDRPPAAEDVAVNCCHFGKCMEQMTLQEQIPLPAACERENVSSDVTFTLKYFKGKIRNSHVISQPPDHKSRQMGLHSVRG